MSSNNEQEDERQKSANELVMIEIEKRNPYLEYNREEGVMVSNRLPDIENDMFGETILVRTSDNRTLVLSRDVLDRAILLQRFSCSIKFLCVVDLVMNFLYLYVGYATAIIFMICSIGGYISTYTYNRKWLLLYLIYQYFQVLIRLTIFVSLIVLTADPTLRPGFQRALPDFELPKNYSNGILLSCLFLIVQGYITSFVQKFYNLLPTNREHQRFLANTQD